MVNYPHKLKIKSKLAHPGSKTAVNFANRGMSFEKMINESNNYYLSRGLAVIHKKPTPIQIVKVDYPQRSRAKIVEAYFRQASTTDYSGVFKGHYIDFEAKETRQKTAMPLKNFHLHQIEHMEAVLQDKGGKSLPLSYIQEHGFLIETKQFPSIPYLEIIEQKLLGGISNE